MRLNNNPTVRSVAAVGDVADIGSWSGIPFHFWQAARTAGFATEAWRMDLDKIGWQRWLWNAAGVVRGGAGGFQYSPWFLRLMEEQIPDELWATEVISFNQHFPRAVSVRQGGGMLNHYLDAPFAALISGRGLDLRLPPRVVESAKRLESENLAGSHRVVTMARWAAEVVREECEVPGERVHVILPGANLNLPYDWEYVVPTGRAGKERPFILGFVGTDWKRKGLPVVISVRNELSRRGWKARVLIAGNASREIQRTEGIEFAGFINKQADPKTFLRFLKACDVGCLFSEREALGISTLEFLRTGVPVAGFAHEGVADTLPPDAGFRFAAGTAASAIADQFEAYLNDETKQAAFRANSRRWSACVTWERCVREFEELWKTGTVVNPVQPWVGLEGHSDFLT